MNLSFITILFSLLMLLPCSSEENKKLTPENMLNFDFSEIDPNPSEKDISSDIRNWIKEYEYIKLVLFDYSLEPKFPLYKNGRFHKGVKNKFTQKLTKAEANIVIDAITGKHLWKGGAFCYQPHHGFIFYNKRNEVVGHIEICFMCRICRSHPKKGLSLYWDLESLNKLVVKKGLPSYYTNDQWNLFWEKHPE